MELKKLNKYTGGMPSMVDWVKIDVLQKGVNMGVTFAIFFNREKNYNFCKLRGQKVCFSLNKMEVLRKVKT